MKLFCRKCNKEIEKYTVRKGEIFDGSFEFTITVCCHGEKDKRSMFSLLDEFNPSEYGDQHFFEKDEPKDFTPLEDVLIKENHTLMRELAFLKGPSLGCVKDCGWLVGKDKEIEKLKVELKDCRQIKNLLWDELNRGNGDPFECGKKL